MGETTPKPTRTGLPLPPELSVTIFRYLNPNYFPKEYRALLLTSREVKKQVQSIRIGLVISDEGKGQLERSLRYLTSSGNMEHVSRLYLEYLDHTSINDHAVGSISFVDDHEIKKLNDKWGTLLKKLSSLKKHGEPDGEPDCRLLPNLETVHIGPRMADLLTQESSIGRDWSHPIYTLLQQLEFFELHITPESYEDSGQAAVERVKASFGAARLLMDRSQPIKRIHTHGMTPAFFGRIGPKTPGRWCWLYKQHNKVSTKFSVTFVFHDVPEGMTEKRWAAESALLKKMWTEATVERGAGAGPFKDNATESTAVSPEDDPELAGKPWAYILPRSNTVHSLETLD